MPNAVIEKEVCKECGAEIREGTAFCYNCGARLGDDWVPPDPIRPLASNGVAETLPVEEKAIGKPKIPVVDKTGRSEPMEIAAGRKLSDAANERRRARTTVRSSTQYTWEPIDEPMSVTLLISAVLFVLISLLIVLMMVWWK